MFCNTFDKYSEYKAKIDLEDKNNYLIVVIGPTAVGKTELCIRLANYLDTAIISADSRQFYKETNLGTAKPNAEEMTRAVHHLVDFKSIHESYDVKDFENDVLNILNEIFKNKDVAILTGGSGLYVDAICNGLDDIPDISPEIRENIISEYGSKGLVYLQQQVKMHDPEYFEIVDQKNPQRLMRALEICRGTGKTYTVFRKKKKVKRPFKIIKVGLERERDEIYQRIDLRMDQMIANGLFEEAANLFPYRHLNALQTVGYSEIFGFMENKYDKEEAIRLLKRNSRRYAKRQLTWFRKDPEYTWFHPDDCQTIESFIKSRINNS
ncbi:MAG: tRNA (adenosine(37)-N6)-dimethylallyltransferase MiaA [Mongoliibacter sp.]|uniref:tRNA (adenosine(37)-N6)-dimethylallyltransferase MiaA n=1 Tax=Mongoliibacter sp. TaxID=2022438 RepID=UPI0012F37E3A|nr:tRNA (adenosine(37)-N6)-dimethylallyltransferase MiaA [Mongoliibacter sp.]TVP48098.1 MAG: tRNA (adenosine(37)-N6)-dimethylallyltransferase MiaA [Mongoliibacter sp.]